MSKIKNMIKNFSIFPYHFGMPILILISMLIWGGGIIWFNEIVWGNEISVTSVNKSLASFFDVVIKNSNENSQKNGSFFTKWQGSRAQYNDHHVLKFNDKMNLTNHSYFTAGIFISSAIDKPFFGTPVFLTPNTSSCSKMEFTPPIVSTNRFSDFIDNNNFSESKPFYKIGKNLFCDHKNYYTRCDNLFGLGLGLMVHATLSNTTVDQNFRNWYQDNVRMSGTNRVSRSLKTLGEGAIWIPIFGITTGIHCISQKFYQPNQRFNFIGDYSSMVLRSYVVGTPTLILFQYMLGCSRPSDDKSYHSQWHFLGDNNSFSGHAFIGAAPFLVAANMTERSWLKVILYLCSTFAGISRINDDAHYLSQVVLGWYVSYLAVRSVSQTNNILIPKNRNMRLFPILDTKCVGIGIVFRR
jgi:membrane-associated phospholipid phosphatase